MNTKSTIKKAFVKTILIMAGYLVLGAGFGILLQSKGFGLPWALASSLFIYAGSMQYLTIDLLTGGAGLVSAAVTALMVNARHIFYGISMVSECGQGVPLCRNRNVGCLLSSERFVFGTRALAARTFGVRRHGCSLSYQAQFAFEHYRRHGVLYAPDSVGFLKHNARETARKIRAAR